MELKLVCNLRTKGSEKEFSNRLLEVGNRRSRAIISLPPSCFSHTQDPAEQLHGDINFKTIIAQQLKVRAILSLRNEDPLEFNNKMLDCISREETVYKNVDTVGSQSSNQLGYPEEFLNSLIPTGMPPHELKLKHEL
jgi:hypothetical protein